MRTCPRCGEEAEAVFAEKKTKRLGRLELKVTALNPPPYCPMCGYPWWREELAEAAERAIADE